MHTNLLIRIHFQRTLPTNISKPRKRSLTRIHPLPSPQKLTISGLPPPSPSLALLLASYCLLNSAFFASTSR